MLEVGRVVADGLGEKRTSTLRAAARTRTGWGFIFAGNSGSVQARRLGSMHSSPMHRSRIIEEYAVSTASTRAAVDAMDGTQPGDPAKAARAILEVLDSPEPPPRPALGNDAVDHIAAHHELLRTDLARRERLSHTTDLE